MSRPAAVGSAASTDTAVKDSPSAAPSSSSGPRWRATPTTLAPALCTAVAMPRPRPRLAPVTSAVVPARSCSDMPILPGLVGCAPPGWRPPDTDQPEPWESPRAGRSVSSLLAGLKGLGHVLVRLRVGSGDVRDVGLPGAGCGAAGPHAGIVELEQADPVVVGDHEPGRQREPEVGDAVDGAQLGEFLDLDAAGPQPGDLAGQVGHPPGRLGRLLPRAGGALGDHQAAVQVSRYNTLSPHLFLHGRAICGTSLLVPCRDGQGCRPLDVQQA